MKKYTKWNASIQSSRIPLHSPRPGRRSDLRGNGRRSSECTRQTPTPVRKRVGGRSFPRRYEKKANRMPRKPFWARFACSGKIVLPNL